MFGKWKAQNEATENVENVHSPITMLSQDMQNARTATEGRPGFDESMKMVNNYAGDGDESQAINFRYIPSGGRYPAKLDQVAV